MAIELYDGVNFDGLFNLQGKAFHAQKTLNTARLTTIPTTVLATLTQFELLTITDKLARTIVGVAPALQSYQSSGGGMNQALQTYAGNLLVEMADADTKLDRKTLEAALRELIRQMESASASVDASGVTLSVATGSANSGNGVLITSKKRGDGRVQENALAETITAKVTSDTAPATAGISFTGDDSEGDRLSEQWPRGSGAGATLTATDAANNLLLNSDFEDEDDVPDAPDDWIVSVGTIGTTLKMTNVEVQTVAISGTPTGGHYLIHFTNAAGKVQTTTPLAYNAGSSTVQSALRLLKGLESITIVESGTTPNFTHTITFTGLGGNITQLTSTSNLTGGAPVITHGTTTQGTAQVFAGGKALEFDSDGAQLTTINQRLTTLKPLTAYAVSLWAIADVVPAAGVITVDLVDGIGGTVINDKQGVANSFTFNAASLTTSWKHLSTLVTGECVFRMPLVVPPLVYLRIRISTAISNTTSAFFDHAALVALTELYSGGPLVAVFSGSNDLKNEDNWTLTVTNDRAGELQEYYNRNFNMAGLGLLLPSNDAGAETIPDTVIA